MDNSEMATATRFDKLKAAADELVKVYRSDDKTYLEVSEKLEKFELILNEAVEDSEEEARLILSVAQWLCFEFRQAFPENNNNHQYYDVLYKPLISISNRLKIIIWLSCKSVVTQKVGEFNFPFNTVEPLFTIKIDNETILKHSISVKSVIELLDLSPNTSPKKRATDIFVNRTEVCSERLMYCTVALTTEQLSTLKEKVPKDMHANVIQNRYGCAVVKFRIKPYLNNESVKFFNLGTKQFCQECMPMVLVHDEESIDSSPWKVFCEGNIEPWSTIDELQGQELVLEEIKEIKPITDFEWGLKYWSLTETVKCWTHPTFIFVNEIKFPEFVPKSESQTEPIPEFELVFEEHQCIHTNDGRRQLCLDCNLFRKSGDNVYVAQRDMKNNQEASNVPVPIRKYKTDRYNCSPEFGIFLFAMSLPVSNRQTFLDKVNEGRYTVNQLEQIQKHWENAPNFYYTDWSLFKS